MAAAKLSVAVIVAALAAGAAKGQDRAPDAQALRIARGILDGTIADPTHGATAFYKPAAMPKEGEPIPAGTDVAGGLESVPGVASHGRPVRNYRPGWATRTVQVHVPGVADRDFRFFRGEPAAGALPAAFAARVTVPAPAGWDPGHTPATTQDVDLAAARAVLARCKTPECLAVVTIGQVMLVAADEDEDDLDKRGWVIAGDRPRVALGRLDEVLLDHPERFASVCRTAAEMLGRVRLTTISDPIYVPVTLLVTAVMMDARGGGDCAGHLVRVLPRNAANDRIRTSAQALCRGQLGGGGHMDARCAVLGRGVGGIDRHPLD